MSNTPIETPVVSPAADPDALPRPEEEVADAARQAEPVPGGAGSGDAPPLDAQAQPAAGGRDDGPAAQGDGAPDSY